MTATEVDEMKATEEFDPALVTLDQVVGLNKAQCTAVLKHYKMPTPPAKWKLDEFRKFAHSTIAGNRPEPEVAADALPAEPEFHDTNEEDAPSTPDAVAEEVAGVALEPHRPDAVSVFPDASKWQQIQSMAIALARSGIVPEALKDKPDDVMVILLAAHDLGIAPTQALQKIHVIKGKPGLAAELMVALALRDGHVVSPDPSNDREHATIHYKRRDNGDSGSITFTIEEAIDAKLVERTGDGKLRAVKGKDTWTQFTADMLWARAVSRMMRRAFPDSTAGISYTPDELGYIDADNDPPKSTAGRHGEATVTLNERRSKLSERAKGLRAEEKAALVEEWRAKNYPKTKGTGPENPARPDFTALTPAVITAIDKFMDRLVEARSPDPEGGEGSEGTNPGAGEAEAGEADSAVGPDPKNAQEAPGGVSGVSPADTGSIPSDGKNGTSDGVEDVPEVCEACEQPFVEGDVIVEADGARYHAGHEGAF